MPPPSLSISTITSFSPEPRRGQQPADVVGERDVADQQHGQPAPGRRDAEGGRHGPVDPVRAAVGEHPERRLARGEERLDVADRHRGGDDQRRLGREDRAELGRDPRLVEARGPHDRGDRPRRRAVGLVPAVEPGRVLALARELARQRLQGRPRVGADDRPDDAGRVLPGALGVERDLQRVQPRQPRGAAAWRWAGRRPAARDPGACPRPSPDRAAARRSARSPPARGARPRSARPAAARPRARRTRPPSRPAAGRARLARRRRSGVAARAAPPRGPRAAGRRRPARQRPRHPRPPAVAPGDDLDVRHAVGTVRDQRLAQREVQVHRAGTPVDRRVERAAGELAQPADAGRAGRVVVDLEVPLGGAAVELDLVDRLPGADVAQLGRAIGGQDEQRHARLVRLDDGGRVVGGGGAGGAGEGGRDAGRLGEAEREERGAALVDVGGGAQAAVTGEREHERRRARAGRGDRVAHAAADELVDERAQAEVGVGSGHSGRGGTRARPVAWLHADPPELAVDGAGAGGTLSRAGAGPARPRPGAAPDGELRRRRVLRPRARAHQDLRPRRLLDGRADRAARGAHARARDRDPAGARRREPGTRRPGGARRRRAADDALADRIETLDIETFAEEWGSQALFAGQPARVAAAAHADRLRNTPAGLASALRGLGTGVMEPLWDRLGELAIPVTLVVGERDTKFRAIAEAMRERLPNARLVVVEGAGHAVQLESPTAVADAITSPSLPRPLRRSRRRRSPPRGARRRRRCRA